MGCRPSPPARPTAWRHRVKKRIIWTALAILCAGQTAAQGNLSTPRLAPTADQAQTAYLSAQILGR